jgi:hypothetical protein
VRLHPEFLKRCRQGLTRRCLHRQCQPLDYGSVYSWVLEQSA